jgi:hypothetical protein
VQSHEELLPRRERQELEGYVSWGPVVGRALLFLGALAIVGVASRRVQQWLHLPEPLWLLPTGLAGLLL